MSELGMQVGRTTERRRPAGARWSGAAPGAQAAQAIVVHSSCARQFAYSPHRRTGVVLLARPVRGRRAAPSLAPAPAPFAPRQMRTQEGRGNDVLAPARHDCLSGIREVTLLAT